MSKDANQSAPATARHPDHFLAEWRDYRGWTQMELGAMADVSHSKISRIESGETALKAGFLRKLARIFHVPEVALLTINPQGEGRKTADMLTERAKLSAAKQEDVLRIMRALQAQDQNGQIG